MASTAFTLYVKPTWAFPSGATAKSSAFTSYIPVRAVSGLYGAGVSRTRVNNWRPHSGVPIGYINNDQTQPVYVNPEWSRHLATLGQKKLGGATFPTLPDIAQFVTQTQVDALLSAAQDQMATANAQTLQTLLQVVQAAGLAGAASIPAPVLARQETNPQPIVDFGETGGGGGGD